MTKHLTAARIVSIAGDLTKDPINAQQVVENLLDEMNQEHREQISLLENELLQCRQERDRLRQGLSKVANNIGNGSAASPSCSLEFLCDSVPNEVKLQCEAYRAERDQLKRQNAAMRGALVAIYNHASHPDTESNYVCRKAAEAIAPHRRQRLGDEGGAAAQLSGRRQALALGSNQPWPIHLQQQP